MNEGSTNTYTVVLRSQPSSQVTITVTKKGGGDDDLTLSGSTLTFTGSNWDTAQTLTVSAAEDDDSSNGSATFVHSARSGDSRYNSVAINNLVASEVDDDTTGVTVTGSPLSVNEGSTNTYTLVLNAQPSSEVTISITKASGGDSDLTLSGSPLTFTSSNWDTAQTLTVSAAEDDADSASGSATFQHSASSTDSRYNGSSVTIMDLVATEVDDDTPGVTVTGSPLSVNEGSTNTYTLVLNAQPSSEVTISITKASGGDSDLTLSGSPLTFTSSNWDTAQTLTVSAAEDDADSASGSATFQHSASSSDTRYGSSLTIAELVANEMDNDTPGVTVASSPLSVNEGGSATYTLVLNAKPSSAVTVSITRKSGGDDDLTLSGSPLTFTSANWNTAQTVTVNAAEDDGDSANGSATFQHSASSSDARYGSSLTIAELVANEMDNDTAAILVNVSPLRVTEGANSSYTLALTAQPTHNVTVTITKRDGDDEDLTLADTDTETDGLQNTLTFTPTNWSTKQTVTVNAAEDGDRVNGTATFQHSASSSDTRYGSSLTIAELVATEADNDMAGIVVDGSPLRVTEGANSGYTLVLTAEPTHNVTVTITKKDGGDGDLTADTNSVTPGNQTTLTFTPTNWSTKQIVTMNAAEDDDMANGTATFQHTASSTDNRYSSPGVTIADLVAMEADNDMAALAVGDAAAQEPSAGESAELRFTVTLSPAILGTVTVNYATRDGTATAGADYTAVSGTLTFTQGQVRKTVAVPVLADAHDENSETLRLVLSNPSGATISDAEATGTINNTGPIPKAWISRFGRTVADQVLEAVEGRMQAAPAPGNHVALAGIRFEGVEKQATLLDTSMVNHPDWLASSFALTPETASGDPTWSLWGQGAVASFDGRDDKLSLDGNVTTALLGADWTWDRNAAPEGDVPGDGRWRAGLLLSHSTGHGGYAGAGDGSASGTAGKVKAHLTGFFPWARRALNNRLAAWGVAGYGRGEITVTPKLPGTETDSAPLSTHLNLWMAAGGLRGTLVDGGSDGLTLMGKTDAMVVGTSSGRATGTGSSLAPAQAMVTRLRLELEASRPLPFESGATLTPSLELGLRHDGGDAETGFGLDLGGGIALSHPEGGLEVDLRGRALLSHAAEGFRDRGFSGSLAWRQKPDSDRGATLSLTQTVGGASSGGADALLSRVTLEGLADNDTGDNDDLRNRRLELKLSYGLPVFGDRFTLTPEVELGLYDGGRDYRIGWSLARPDDVGSFTFSFDATRREAANKDSAAPEHGIQLGLNTRF